MININCVYGPEHVHAIKSCMIPSLLQHENPSIRLNVISYDPEFSGSFGNVPSEKITVREYSSLQKTGFGESHNILAKQVDSECFIIVNPDCFFFKETISSMLEFWNNASTDVGIVEGRQWPFTHPKGYDAATNRTHWASGAFCLFDTLKFQSIGGFDPAYFMYLEDVDISWRMWINGYSVLHAPRSVIAHFTGVQHSKQDRISLERYYSLRNHLLITRKFLGVEAEAEEMNKLATTLERSIFEQIKTDVEVNFSSIFQQYDISSKDSHSMITLREIGVYHA